RVFERGNSEAGRAGPEGGGGGGAVAGIPHRSHHRRRHRQDRCAKRERGMSAPVIIESFEQYLSIIRDELPKTRIYFRGQSQLVNAGIALGPSIGRYQKLAALSLFERDQIERQMLGVSANHLLSHVSGARNRRKMLNPFAECSPPSG